MDRYASVHRDPQGMGDARPTAEQIIHDQNLVGKLTDKATVLITGGTAGLGTESARVLQQTGAKLYITARSAVKGAEVAKALNDAQPAYPTVEVIVMDNNNLTSVREGAAEFLRRSKQLNILMTNAGLMACPEGRTTDGFETQFGVNHLAHFLLFQLLKNTMIASSPEFQGRVISVSSAAHKIGGIHPDTYNLEGIYDPFVAYGQSKTANIYMANEIERRYAAQGLHAWSLHPGTIFETDVSRFQEGGRNGLLDRMGTSEPSLLKHIKSTGQGTATQVWAAVAKELEGKGGLYLDNVQIAERAGDGEPVFFPGWKDWIWDQQLAERLWTDSLRMVGMQ